MKGYSLNYAAEILEERILLSFTLGLDGGDDHSPGHGGGGPGGGGGGNQPSGPEIDLFAVALHEFGHSLGLGHSDPNDGIPAVMDPFYLGPVSGLQPQDISRIQALYPESGSGGQPWVNTDITYSFTPGGARMDQGGRNAIFKTLDKAFGDTATWQQIFVDAFAVWTAASAADGSNTVLIFEEVADAGLPFNYIGDTQEDPDSGDIRIAMHGFDGASGVLAHAYFPPPNGSTAAGDAHFDKAENWKDLSGALSLTSSESTTTSGSNSLVANMTLSVPEVVQDAAADTTIIMVIYVESTETQTVTAEDAPLEFVAPDFAPSYQLVDGTNEETDETTEDDTTQDPEPVAVNSQDLDDLFTGLPSDELLADLI
jgi:hypothetical protein